MVDGSIPGDWYSTVTVLPEAIAELKVRTTVLPETARAVGVTGAPFTKTMKEEIGALDCEIVSSKVSVRLKPSVEILGGVTKERSCGARVSTLELLDVTFLSGRAPASKPARS